jgi:hypothetical protein
MTGPFHHTSQGTAMTGPFHHTQGTAMTDACHPTNSLVA